MILSEEEVLKLAINPVSSVIAVNRKLQNDHKVHIEGTGFESVLTQIIGYENVEQFKQKKLLTKPFTRLITRRIINEQSRWKTASGSSKFYKFKKNTETLSNEFAKEILSQCWNEGSINVFIKEFLSEAIYTDFNGFFLIEKGAVIQMDKGILFEEKQGIRREIKPNEKLKPYITYKSVDDVIDFKVTGNRVEWIVFKFKEIERNGVKIKLVRVIDDVKDYVLEVKNNKAFISEEFPVIEHKVGRCPVVNVSFKNRNITDSNTKTSPIDEIVQILDYHLHQFAEHLVTEILHAHPNYYQTGQRCTYEKYGQQCLNGHIIYTNSKGDEIDEVCSSCKGTGHNLHKDASTTIILPAIDSEGKPFNISNVAGYVTPPVDILEYQIKAIDWMKAIIFEAALGIKSTAQKESLVSTATEVVSNIRPLEDIVSEISDMIAKIEKNITDIIGRMYYGDNYVGSEIFYGKKLNLKEENTLIKEIKEAKESGASNQYVKTLCEELVYTRFSNSESDLQRNILLLELEPLVGYTFNEVEGSQFIPDEVKRLKQNFTDLIQRFEIENGLITDYKPEQDLRVKVKVNDIKQILINYLKPNNNEPNE